MLRDKGTIKIEEIKTDFNPERFDEEKITSIFKALKISESLKEFNCLKQNGYSVKTILSLLLVMVVTGKKTVLSSMSSIREQGIPIGKDVFYRLKNKEQICWRSILWHIVMKFIRVTVKESKVLAAESKKPHCLIFDDTTVKKSGKKMEKLGRVWDHVGQCSILGYKILVMLYWDGTSFIPVDFSIHREKGKKESKPYGMSKKELRCQYSKKRSKKSESDKRIKELDTTKMEMMLRMLYNDMYRCLRVDYVLCDSWFTCEALINAVIDQGVHLIGMYKIAGAKFSYRGQQMTYSEINNRISKLQRCRSLKYHYKRADVMYGETPLTLFFSRQGTNGKWKVFLTTDTSLGFKKLVELYQIRWTVEVFNKEAKGLLNLGGCQSSNFDAQIADTTISMIAYILLSFRFRYEHYESKGALYRLMNAEFLQMTIDKRLWILFLETIQILAEILEINADDLLKKVLTNPDVEHLFIGFSENELKTAG
jgi:hypothetical protein